MADLFESPADTVERIERALSLTQPWATLVAIGAKLYETRSWQTSYRGWLAIQAAKGFPDECMELCDEEPFSSALFAGPPYEMPGDLPRGQVIAAVRLTDCISTNVWTPPRDSNEYAFGNYEPNRFAWKLEDVRRLKEPFYARGALSIWKLPAAITLAELV